MKASGYFILLLVAFSGATDIGACEMLTLPPVEPIQGLVSFIGQVEQPLTPQPIPGVTSPAPGVVVRVLAPSSDLDPGTMVEVIPLGVDPACEPTPWSVSTLTEFYPAGARVTVLGRALSDDVRDSGVPKQIVMWPSDFGGLGRVPDQVDRIPVGCLDFEAFRATHEKNPYATWSRDIAWRNTQRAWFEDFEFLSCLARAQTLTSPLELEVALHAMAFYSRYDGVNAKVSRQLYANLVKRTQLPRSARGRLNEQFAAIHDAR
jgi:hypothetical protein